MSTKRDLVEAHAFSRRRLVTAFVSGAPGGREVEPVRPGRAVIGGVALAVLLLAGAAIAGVFSGRAQEGWRSPGLIIAEETGAGYVVIEDGSPIQPVVNTVSAQLIFGGALDPKSVPLDDINSEELGEPVGIFGAPESLPQPGSLVASGWTACTNGQGGLRLRVQPEPAVTPRPGAAVLVGPEPGHPKHLVVDNGSGAYRLALPERGALALLALLEIPSDSMVAVPAQWLELFPPGPALELASFETGTGPTSYDPGLRAGDVVTIGDATYLLRHDDIVRLDGFAARVYLSTSGRGERPEAIAAVNARNTTLFPQWPAELPDPLHGEPCGVLVAEPGEPPRTLLAGDPSDAASAEGLGATRDVDIEPRYGAYVRTAGYDDERGGTPWVVDSQGIRYHLGGAARETAALLGYADFAVPTIPEAWIEPLRCGPELSQAAAMASPESTEDSGCAS